MIQPKSCAPDLLTRPSNSPCSSARTHSRLISRLVLLTLKYLCVLGPRLLVNVRNSFVLKDFSPTNWQFLGGFGKGAGAADDGHQKNAESCNNELLQKVPRSVAVLYKCGRDDECSQNQRLKAQLRVKQMLQQCIFSFLYLVLLYRPLGQGCPTHGPPGAAITYSNITQSYNLLASSALAKKSVCFSFLE